MLHVFPFSAREGTGAYHMKNQVDPKIKKQRAAVLLDLSKQLWNKYTDKFVGKDIEVLIEKIGEGYAIGHTTNYIDAKIQDISLKPGDRISVKLQKSMIIS